MNNLNTLSLQPSHMVAAVGGLGVMFAMIIGLAGTTIGYSHQVAQLARHEQTLLRQQQILTEQLAQQQSIAVVEHYAQAQAMIPLQASSTIDVNVPLAQVASSVVVQ
jgi:hypothetical protein